MRELHMLPRRVDNQYCQQKAARHNKQMCKQQGKMTYGQKKEVAQDIMVTEDTTMRNEKAEARGGYGTEHIIEALP